MGLAQPTSPCKVFVVEDDHVRINLMLKHGAGLDFTVAEKLSGTQGAYKKWQPPYDLILLDHDLGGRVYVPSDEEETGYQFCRWLGKAPSTFDPRVIVHSYNPDGAEKMVKLLRENGWRVHRELFGINLLNALAGLAGLPQVARIGQVVEHEN